MIKNGAKGPESGLLTRTGWKKKSWKPLGLTVPEKLVRYIDTGGNLIGNVLTRMAQCGDKDLRKWNDLSFCRGSMA